MQRQRARKAAPRAIKQAGRRIADDLKSWRKLRGLTQAQLADRSGVSLATVTRLESGDGNITLASLLRILRALGVLDSLTTALDPYESDIGRMRSEEELPQRIRPARLTRPSDGRRSG
jgi:transcriptional regulator with XRE-family HTH domain